MQGISTLYLSVIVLLPLSALVWTSFENGWSAFWEAISTPQAVGALKLTLFVSLLVAGVNAVMGTIVAWILVRDRFPGQ